jgi:hypothetical protein
MTIEKTGDFIRPFFDTLSDTAVQMIGFDREAFLADHRDIELDSRMSMALKLWEFIKGIIFARVV